MAASRARGRVAMENCQKAYSKGRWRPELCEEIWEYFICSPCAVSALLAYDIQHCISGLHEDHLLCLDEWHNRQDRISWPLVWRLLSAEVHLQLFDQARKRLNRYRITPWNKAQRRSLLRFPLALNFCQQECGWIFTLWDRDIAKKSSEIIASQSELTTWVDRYLQRSLDQARTARIAVVGNGPSLIGTRAGKRIDSCDMVIRFNEVHTEEPFEIDSGRHTNLWVISPSIELGSSSIVSSDICLSGPAPLMRGSNYWLKLAIHDIHSLSVVSLNSWYSLVQKLQAPPTAGLLILDSLIRHHSGINVEIHGFTVAAIGNLIDLHEKQGQHYADMHTPSERHNWQGEAALIRDWVNAGKLISPEAS